MRVLCCLDGTNVEHIKDTVTTFLRTDQLAIGLLYVVDTGPEEEIGRQRSRFLRPPGLGGARQEKMQEAEQFAAEDILAEGKRSIADAEVMQRKGRPEREIVNCAAAWNADLLIICSRSPYMTGEIGPRSVGHVARFVLDHAPCPVMLVRPRAHDRFPIDAQPPRPLHGPPPPPPHR